MTDFTEPSAANPARPSLLLVANYSPDVGYAWWLMENFWIQAAAAGRRFGLEPLLVYPQAGAIPSAIRDAAIPTRVMAFPGRGVRGLWRSVWLIRSERIRVIYFTDRGFSRFSYLLFRLAGVRRIINHDHTPGDRPPSTGLKGFLKAFLRRLSPIGCDIQICVSPLIQERAVRNARIPIDRTVVVQNGIEPIACREEDHAQRTFGIAEDHLVVITVARASPYKRIDFVIETARWCLDAHGFNDIVFIHCGDGPDLPRLRSLADRLRLGKHFVFGGRRSDIHRLLCSADIAIHPAKGEAFSLAILEYMSAGLALVVPDVPSVAQAVQQDATGLVYADGDVEQAASAIARLRRDPSLRERLGSAAKEEVRRRYSLRSMNEAFMRAIEPSLEQAS